MKPRANIVVAFTNGHPNTVFPVAEDVDLVKKMIDNCFKTRFGIINLTLVSEDDGTVSPLVINMQNDVIFAIFIQTPQLIQKVDSLILPRD